MEKIYKMEKNLLSGKMKNGIKDQNAASNK